MYIMFLSAGGNSVEKHQLKVFIYTDRNLNKGVYVPITVQGKTMFQALLEYTNH